MRVTLVFPPNREVPASVFGALPLLAACLRRAGHEVAVVDANLEVFDRLVARETIESFRAEFEHH